MPATVLAGGEAPRVQGAIERVQLLDRLDRLRSHQLIQIIGADGLGKTTLVADYATRRRIPSLWICLEQSDNDPGCFFAHLSGVLRGRPWARELPLYAQMQGHDLSGFARRYFCVLFKHLPADSMLVLDNCEAIEDVSEFPMLLREALDVTPAGTQCYAIGRAQISSDLEFLLDTFRGAAIDHDALRLSREDHERLSSGPTRDRLMTHPVELIATARMRLLCEGGSKSTFPTDLDDKALYFACAQNLMSALRESDRQALYALATLDRFSSRSVGALTNESRLMVSMNYWLRNHIMVQARGEFLVFHPLLREWLLGMLHTQRGPQRPMEAVASAARLCEVQDQVDAAIALHVQTQDWSSVSALLQRHASTEIAQGRWARLRTWIQAMPDEVLERTPMLRYWLGRTWQSVEVEFARLSFRRARTQFEALDDARGTALCVAGLIWTSLAPEPASQALPELARVLDQCLDQFEGFDVRALELNVLSALQVAALWSGSAPGGLARRCSRIHEMMGLFGLTINEKLAAASHLLEYYDVTGRVDLARQLIDQVRAECGASNLPTRESCDWKVACARHYALIGADEGALQLLRTAIDTAQAQVYRALEVRARHLRIPLLVRRGRLAKAAADLQVTAPLIQARDHAAMAAQAITSAIHAHALGNDHETMRHANAFVDIALHSVPRYLLLQWGGWVVAWQAERDRTDAALTLLVQLGKRAQHFCHEPWRASVSLLHAYVSYQHGNDFDTSTALSECLKLLQNNPDWRHCLRPIARHASILLAYALKRDIARDAALDLIRDLNLGSPSQTEIQWEWPIRVYTLGELRIARADAKSPLGGALSRRQRRILVLLVSAGTRGTEERVLVEALGMADYASARRRVLTSVVKSLRKLLGDEKAIVWEGRTLRLDGAFCWVDAWCFEEWTEHEPRRALPIFTGEFAPGQDEPVALAYRERLHEQFVRTAVAVGLDYENQSQHDAALALYRAALEVDKHCEAFYQGVMRCELQQGRPKEAAHAYDLLTQALASQTNFTPSLVTQRIRAIAAKAQGDETGAEPSSH